MVVVVTGALLSATTAQCSGSLVIITIVLLQPLLITIVLITATIFLLP